MGRDMEQVAAPNSLPGETQPLIRLAEIAEQLEEAPVAAELRRLASRIREGRFFVACIGQFKRGKSTLLNALVGESILPTGIVPVTAVPTVVRYGAEHTARVLIGDRWQPISPQDLANYVAEERNPENVKEVEGVEVFLPSPLLASGMCLVDTPGVGSVFSANTEATREFIPQIDAAILVLGADPPISAEELALVEAVAANVDQILILLNKIDRATDAERRESSSFAARVIEQRLKRPAGRIHQVSALERLNNSGGGDDWSAFVEDLRALAGSSRQAMTHAAAERGVRRFSKSLRHSLDERLRALQEPIADSEQRIAGLRRTLAEAEQWLRDLGALFSAEQQRLSMTLLGRRKEFLQQTLPFARQDLERESLQVTTSFGPARRRSLMALAQAIARRHVMPWLDSEEAHGEELYAAVTARFVSLVNGLLQRIAEQTSAGLAYLPKALDGEHGFRVQSRFFFHDMLTIAQPASPLLYSLDVLMGALRARRWFQRDADTFLLQLLDTNASRVQAEVEQRVVESRLRLESDVRKLLREVSATAEQALSRARELLAAGAAATQNEVARLSRMRQELDGTSPTADLHG